MLSCVRLFETPWTVARQAPVSLDFPDKNTGVGCHFLLQGIFPTQGSNPSLLHLLHWQADSLLDLPLKEANTGIRWAGGWWEGLQAWKREGRKAQMPTALADQVAGGGWEQGTGAFVLMHLCLGH